MAKIFISYKRADKKKVFKIKDQIEKAVNGDCWVDLEGIESDAAFANNIATAINECEVFLFMYSKEHTKIKDFQNDWTVREISYAQERRKRIVFVNIDKTPLIDYFCLLFSNRQQIDVTENYDKLIKDLKRWVGEKPQNTISRPFAPSYAIKKKNNDSLVVRLLKKLFTYQFVCLIITVAGFGIILSTTFNNNNEAEIQLQHLTTNIVQVKNDIDEISIPEQLDTIAEVEIIESYVGSVKEFVILSENFTNGVKVESKPETQAEIANFIQSYGMQMQNIVLYGNNINDCVTRLYELGMTNNSSEYNNISYSQLKQITTEKQELYNIINTKMTKAIEYGKRGWFDKSLEQIESLYKDEKFVREINNYLELCKMMNGVIKLRLIHLKKENPSEN